MKKLFGYTLPADDYFNDNLDQYYEEDDYFDYNDHPEKKFGLEDKEYTHSHLAAHKEYFSAEIPAELKKALSPQGRP